MKRIRWTPLAINDLKNISSYIESHRNLAPANRVCRVIYDAVQILRIWHSSGRNDDRTRPERIAHPAYQKML